MTFPTTEPPTPLDYQSRPPRRSWLTDDIAYIAPMAAFLIFVWVGGHWPALYPASYIVREIAAVILLFIGWRHYTKIRWNGWWLGVIVGVIGIFQWVGMQLWLQNSFPKISWFQPDDNPFNPLTTFASPLATWSFITVRIIGAVLVVPVMEELFWRDFLWREIMSPNDFKLAEVGEFEWTAYLGVAIAFSLVHGNWWLTAIVWALMIGALLAWTRSLGACIIAHAVTNLLLAIYVLKFHAWSFW
jgi:CAAX prenyl protease-like protein